MAIFDTLSTKVVNVVVTSASGAIGVATGDTGITTIKAVTIGGRTFVHHVVTTMIRLRFRLRSRSRCRSRLRLRLGSGSRLGGAAATVGAARVG